MKNALWLSIVVLVISCSCGKENNDTDSVAETRSDYIEKTIARLRAFKPTDNPTHQVEELQGRFLHHGGFIPVGEDGWVYCIGRSFHEDPEDSVHGGIGEVNMAIDHKGSLYVNREHLCEGPAFWSASRHGLTSMKEFYAEKWIRYRLEPQASTGKVGIE